ncbi:MAG: RIP metalloprotease RseP [Candidatus Latescibacterota bacterium]|nr:MAG: RIP metalloprotease RseP [Candidatus Latescibacterota bacterium]
MLITILAGVFILSIVIIVHEFGHFIVAKKLGIFVKVFSVGFGRKLIKKRIGETVYAISALPFGGYVKFAGESETDIEQGGDKAEEPKEQKTDEIPDSEIDPDRYFINKRPLIRSAVVFAGPFFNYVLAVLIYVAMFAIQGLRLLPETATIGQVTAGSPADSVGLMVGDEILEIAGTEVASWGDIVDVISVEKDNVIPFHIKRGVERLDIDFKCRIEDNRIEIGFLPHIASLIGQVKRDGPAYEVGIRPGATIDAINDTLVSSFYDIERIIHANPNVPLEIRWSQNEVEHVDSVTPVPKKVLKEGSRTEFEIVGQIGVGPHYETERVPLHRAAVMGFESSNRMIKEIVLFLRLLLTGRAGVDALGGPILITQMAGDMARWGFNYLIYFLAFFSINLCIFNLLPILPFDGGHLTLFFYEGVARRRVNRRLRELLTQAGFVLLILLMVFVVVIDLSRCTGSSPTLF